jgi:hypothetical protein
MAPWAIALIFIAVLCVGGWLVDNGARRKRRGLENVARPAQQHAGRVAEAERIDGGITQRATGTNTFPTGP